jgi:uncharacterized protein YpuA (DUF1002 family)
MRKVRSRSALVVLIAFLAVLLMGCARKAQGDDCVQKLSERIQAGTSQADAEEVLDQCGFTHSFDQETSTIHGLKHGEKDLITRQDWTAQIKLDEARKVKSVRVEKVFTGP